jgi:hypothetical protein
MRRLEAGDKRKRRKKTFGAAKRTYEAIIGLLQAQHRFEWYRCRAAEAETAEARAEICLRELRSDNCTRAHAWHTVLNSPCMVQVTGACWTHGVILDVLETSDMCYFACQMV